MILVAKPGCHLCDVARDIIDLVCAQADADWIELSIFDDAQLAAMYADQIPVVLVDGQVHDVYRVNPERLLAALSS